MIDEFSDEDYGLIDFQKSKTCSNGKIMIPNDRKNGAVIQNEKTR